MIPTEFLKYTNVVESKETFDACLKKEIQTICVDNKEIDFLMTQIKDKVMQMEMGKTDLKRQRYFEDYGYSGDQCCTQYTNLTGDDFISTPALRKYTDDELNNDIIVAASKLIFDYCPWIWFGIGDERRQKFAQNIHNNNRYIKACRFAVYHFDINNITKTKGNLCETHLDTQNGQGEALSQVFIISKMVWEKKNVCGWRVAIICYTRHSITNYFTRKDETIGPAVNHVINEYSKFCESRRCIKALKRVLGEQKMITLVSQKPFCEVRCHMNPAVFLSPVVFHIHQLVCHYNLNFIGVISLLRAWVELQWTPCYFCAVCEKMMNKNELKVRGMFIGHYVLEKMYCMYYHRKENSLSHPGKRFFIIEM